MENMTDKSLMGLLTRGLEQLGQDPETHPCSRYLAYIDLLHDWNRAYNLTGVKKRRDMLIRHILDSLTLLPYVHGDHCLDVGSGAGLPGMPLALACPCQYWTLLDSNSKKVRFLHQVVLELQPVNVGLVHTRLQDYRPPQRFHTIVTRAFSSLAEFHRQAAGLLYEGGRLIAMKGRRPDAELAQLAGHGITCDTVQVRVPLLEVTRHLVLMDSGPG